MSKVILIALLALAPAIAQTSTPPAGYVNVSISGMATTIPTLDTAVRSQVQMLENTSILSLVNEGIVNPEAAANAIIANAAGYCAEAQGQATGCGDQAALVAPYVAQVRLVFSLVPAPQWDPTKFSVKLPVYAAAYVQAAPPTPPPAPPKPSVGSCFTPAGSTVTMCYPMAGGPATPENTPDGTIVPQNGKNYRAHVSVGLMGPALWFEPLN